MKRLANNKKTIIIRIKDNGTARAIQWNSFYSNSSIVTRKATIIPQKEKQSLMKKLFGILECIGYMALACIAFIMLLIEEITKPTKTKL